MNFIDHDNTDLEDLPEDMQPDPYCVWVYLVAPDTNHTSVCFDKEMAEHIAEAKVADVKIKRTRMWFSSDVAEKEVHAVPGSRYNQ